MYAITGNIALTAPLMASVGPFGTIETIRSDWGKIIPKIEKVDRDALVFAQIRDVEGFENLDRLRGLIDNPDPSLPLDEEFPVNDVHVILRNEITNHPSLYSPEDPLDSYGFFPLHADLFAGVDPKKAPINPRILDAVKIHNELGHDIGQAVICAGGVECATEAHLLKDGSRISASTFIGNCWYQQDAFYYAFLELSAGVFVKTLVASDAMGPNPINGMSTSAFLQGIHADVVSAARVGSRPNPALVYIGGQHAMQFQKKHIRTYPLQDQMMTTPSGGGTMSIAIILGNDAFIATSGDSAITFSRRLKDGCYNYKTVGYSHIDCINAPYILSSTTSSFPRLYTVKGMKHGDRLIIGSDGIWENILPADFKIRGSSHLRKQHEQMPPTQKLFANLNYVLKQSSGQILSAQHFISLACRNPYTIHEIFGIYDPKSFFDRDHVYDNLVVIDYEHEEVPETERTKWPMSGYLELEPVSDS